MTNNQGIDHIASSVGGFPFCRNRKAHLSISVERYRADEGTGLHRYCARCVAYLAKRDAIIARRLIANPPPAPPPSPQSLLRDKRVHDQGPAFP
jgi:hypothetical protein